MHKVLLSSALLTLCLSSVHAISIEELTKDALINNPNHTLAGTFGKHDFANAESAFDWAFTTANGVSYQLKGNQPSATDAFGWKAAGTIAAPTPLWYMFAVDIDGNGIKGPFEWVLLSANTSKKAAYKLAGANDDGTFAYSAKLDIDYEISGNSIKTGAMGTLDAAEPTDNVMGSNTWLAEGVMYNTWDAANTACSAKGARLPTLAELQRAHEQNIGGFSVSHYWTSEKYTYFSFESNYSGKVNSLELYDFRCITGEEYVEETVDPNDSAVTSVVYKGIEYGTVVSPNTGRIWLDRNLGAYQICTGSNSCAGHYFQWGREADGHESSSYSVNDAREQASDIVNVGTKFIKYYDDEDWTTADAGGVARSANWSKTDGSSICPSGYRIPTDEEFAAETTDVGVENLADAQNSFLRIGAGGYRNGYAGAKVYGDSAYIWTSKAISDNGKTKAYVAYFSSFIANVGTHYPIYGCNVRCIKN